MIPSMLVFGVIRSQPLRHLPGEVHLAVIRMSGAGVRNIADRIFVPNNPGMLSPWKLSYGQIRNILTGDPIDEVLLVCFNAPKSFTAEDMIEVYCHGSPAVSEAVLKACFDAGARQANPGEFTQRAFHNGRIDLSQAEAVALLTAAANDTERRAALALLAGGLSTPLKQVRNGLIHAIAGIELDLDFPEEDSSIPLTEILGILTSARNEIQSILVAGERTERLSRGIRVVIAGKVNAGKSRLFNRLSGVDRAIVTEEPGTTRDPIEIGLAGRSMDITLVDTAGLRVTDSIAETEGIRRTLLHLEAADLILAVIDLTAPDSSVIEPLCRFIGHIPIIVVCNKVDCVDSSTGQLTGDIASAFPGCPCMYVSAKRGDGIQALRDAIEQHAGATDAATGSYLALTTRNRTALLESRSLLEDAIRGLSESMPYECVVPVLRSVCERIDAILGIHIPPDILGTIFSSFCIGK